MRNELRRFVACFLVLMLSLTVLPASAFAEGEDALTQVQVVSQEDSAVEDAAEESEATVVDETDGEEAIVESQEAVTETEEAQVEEDSDDEAIAAQSEEAQSVEAEQADTSDTTATDTVPVYRLYNQRTNEHLYTTSASEKNTLYEKNGWGYEGIAWYAPTSGDAVYRLYNAAQKNHLYTTDKNEVASLKKAGWTVDNSSKAVFYSGGDTPVYRVYNAGANGLHHLTTDKNEYTSLGKNGWKKEGISLYCVKTGEPAATEYYKEDNSAYVAIYRLYNPGTGEHLYTADANEKDTLYDKHGWGYEGIGWYTLSSGTPVYRLFNAKQNNHLYTTDTNEVKVLTTTAGWIRDNGGKPVFYSAGDTPIYRLYNKKLSGIHLLTTDLNEYNTLARSGWTKEGVAVRSVKAGTPTSVQYKIERNGFCFDPPSQNCICISIDKQQMALFKNNKAVVVTPIVTGMLGVDDTKKGTFSVQEKVRNFRTVGPGFDAVCDYWITLYTGTIWAYDKSSSITGKVGIHDASWRSTYGGTIYKTNGSHGCVNTPYSAMKSIYNNCYVGMPVYIK